MHTVWGSQRLATRYRLLHRQVKRMTEYSSARSTGEEYTVNLATSKEDFDFIQKLTFSEQWPSVGVHCLAHVTPVIKPGFFIGRLNEQRICQVSVVQYGDKNNEFYFPSYYIVNRHFRSKRYGLKIIEAMLATLPDNCNIGFDSLPDMVPEYEKQPTNAHKEWLCKEYIISCSKVVEKLPLGKIAPQLKPLNSTDMTIKPFIDVDFEKLFEYDTSVFGFPRRDFLKKWITIPESLGWAVTNSSGDVVGYAVIQPSIVDKHQIVGPLFSDDTHIARILLHTAAEAAIEQKSAEKLTFWTPMVVDQEFVDTIETDIGYDSVMEAYRMYTRGVPPQVRVEKMMAITSPAYG